MFFSSGEESKVRCIFVAIRLFEVVSGLKVNLSKSSITGINLQQSRVQSLAEILGCSSEKLPMKYLRLPLGGNPINDSFWMLVVEKIGSKLEGWKRVLLSKGGRYMLIQSVLSDIPIYFFVPFQDTG